MDLYNVLSIDPEADMSEIRSAYRRAALVTHPDKEGGSAEAFHAVANAFAVLSCHLSRSMYDRARARSKAGCYSSVNSTDSFKSAEAKPQAAASKGRSHSTSVTKKRPGDDVRICARSKRFRASQKSRTNATNAEIRHNVNSALEDLQEVLQSMDVEWRQTSIAQLPAHTRKALLYFMERKGNKRKACESRHLTRSKGRAVTSGSVQLQPVKSTYGRTFTAHVDIAFLRMWTRGQRDIEKAIEHQLILTEVRDAICHVDAGVWKDDDKVQRIIEAVLERHATSQEQLGLRACVQMRATKYVDRKYVITSPVTCLAKALTLRSRLVSARSASWQIFRDHWVTLMCCTRNARSRHLSRPEAEAICSKARREFCEKRLKVAIWNTDRTIKREQQHVAKLRMTQQQSMLTHAALKNRWPAKHSDLWKYRVKLLLQRELTTEEELRFR